MDACSQLQPVLRHVRDANLADCSHQVQRHFGDLVSVPVAVPLGQAAHHHVGIPDGLHLVRMGRFWSVHMVVELRTSPQVCPGFLQVPGSRRLLNLKMIYRPS